MMASPWARIVLSIVLLSVLSSVFFAFLKRRHDLNPFNDTQFNATVWRSEEARTERSKRATMAGDLIHNHLKRGMTDEAVKALLGEPNKLWQPEQAEHRDTYEYDMGHVAWDW